LDSDGAYESSTDSASTFSHTYLEPGTFNVTLRVTDNDMLTDTNRITITLNNVVPEVPLGTIIASAAMIVALVGYIAIPKFRKSRQFTKGSIA
jgi:PKD repeat protein